MLHMYIPTIAAKLFADALRTLSSKAKSRVSLLWSALSLADVQLVLTH